ncbi:hypothetical protein ABZZ20_34775 [Streptomyces sp. NPDC006430]|uniref:hypothetical protein n=1 Tax=Streptomyces sp. NPDC006430 TaxID=3154299 RepID=UPI0033A36E20
MSIWAALPGGFVGTLVLTTSLRAANTFHLTRIELPFLLGTAFTSDRTRAKALGYGAHFVNGLIFALIYYAVFAGIDYSSWWLGTIFGLVHGLQASPDVVAQVGAAEADEQRVIEETALYLAERQPVMDLPPLVDLDDVAAAYGDHYIAELSRASRIPDGPHGEPGLLVPVTAPGACGPYHGASGRKGGLRVLRLPWQPSDHGALAQHVAEHGGGQGPG